MNRSRLQRCILTLASEAALITVCFWPAVSQACSGPAVCELDSTAELGRSGLPENAPAIAVHTQWGGDAGFVLFRADGGVVAAQVTGAQPPSAPLVIGEAAFVQPAAALVAGERYVVRNNCDRLGHTFEVTAARPLPTALGTVSVASTGTELVEVGTSGSLCSKSIKAAVAHLKIVPSAELAPFAAATGWTLKVDGAVWARSRFGAISPAGEVETIGSFPQRPDHRIDTVYAACTGGELGLGSHQATLEAELAGAGTLPAQQVSFTLDCGPAAGCGCASADASQLAAPLFALSLFLFRARRRARR